MKRKTLIKDGRRPTVSTWQRYWLQLWGSSLVYFSPKTLAKGVDRRDFKTEPCKFKTVLNWIVMVADNPEEMSFQITDKLHRNVRLTGIFISLRNLTSCPQFSGLSI